MPHYEHAPTDRYRLKKTSPALRSSFDPSRPHIELRDRWVQGLSNAQAELSKLSSEGWLTDLASETYFQSQAEALSKRLESQGFLTRTVPVAEFEGQPIVYLVYKRNLDWKPPEPNPQKPAEKKREQEPSSSKDRFLKAFQGKFDDHYGMYFSSDHVLAYVASDAPDTDAVRQFRETWEQAPQLARWSNMQPAKYLTAAENDGKQFVKFGETVVKIKNLRKALHVMGAKVKTKNVEIRAKAQSEPLIIGSRDTGELLITAPVLTASPEATVGWLDLVGLYGR